MKRSRVNTIFLRFLVSLAATGALSTGLAARSRLGAPTNLTASATSASQIVLTWSTPKYGQNPASYSVWRCQGASCNSFAEIGSVGAGSTTYQDSGLAASTVYDYQVRSVNSNGATGSPSNTAAATTLAVAAVPVITSASSANGTAGNAFDYQIMAANSPTGFAANGLPAGLSVNASTGLISGSPTTAGTSTVTLSATNATGTGTAPLSLTITASSGTGTQAQIAATPSSAAFGAVTEGTMDSQPITLNNSGNTTLTFSQIAVTGAGFAQTGLSTSTTIAAGGSTIFNATFSPASATTVNGSIALTTNGTPSPLVISLSGTGQAASLQLSASPTNLAFGNVLDQSSSQLSASVTNNGNASVTISSVTVMGAGFSASGIASGTVLTPGQSLPLTVTFAPTSGGAVSGASVSIASNATNSPTTISLSGAGMHSVLLTWDASLTGGVAYNVFRGTSAGGEGTTPVNTAPLTSLTYTDTSVTPGTTYYYTVEAVDSTGSSSPSNEASAQIPSP